MTKRAYGTGGIRNKGSARSPRWHAYHHVVIDGRRRQISRGFTRKADAEAWLKAELRLVDEGRAANPGSMIVAELAGEWLEVHRDTLEPNTWAEYGRQVRQRVNPHLGM